MEEKSETLVNGETFLEASERKTKEIYEYELERALTPEERSAVRLVYQGNRVLIEGPESVKEKAQKVYKEIFKDD
jgi:hypothetical protein